MINLEQARDLLKRAMETQGPNFIYNPGGTLAGRCYYEPKPDETIAQKRVTGCLIGVALDLAGETRHHGSNSSIYGLSQDYPDMISQGAQRYFAVAQDIQDHGWTWGYAYDQAEGRLKDRNPLKKD